MDARELKLKVSNHLWEMIIDIGDTFDVEFDTDHEGWNELEDNIVNTLFELKIDENE